MPGKEHDGQIVWCKLHALPQDCHFACQAKSWFNEDVILEWVNQILSPYYVFAALPGIFPTLIKATVMTAIQNYGIEMFFIPPG